LMFSILGAHIAGVTGLVIGWMAAVVIEAFVMLPTVIAVSPWRQLLRHPIGKDGLVAKSLSRHSSSAGS
jgi:hypothetical protein